MSGARCPVSRWRLKSTCGGAVAAALSTAAASFLEAAISPASAPADATLGVLLVGGSLADVLEPLASPEGARMSSMISCMERPRCGGELDRIAVTNWLSFRGLWGANNGVTRPDIGAEPPARRQAHRNCRSIRLCRARSDNGD